MSSTKYPNDISVPSHSHPSPSSVSLPSQQQLPNPNVQNNPYVYMAVYSSVPVYEMMVKGIGVMRRRSDSYMNATQILKVAGVDKSKRTRILDREIIQGEHEKIQGGYGRYQGTWVPFARAKELAARLGVAELLAPLFEYSILPTSQDQTTQPTHISNPSKPPSHSNRSSSSKSIINRKASRQSLADKRERSENTSSGTNHPPEAGPSKRSRLNTPTRRQSNGSTGTPSSIVDHYSSTLDLHPSHPRTHTQPGLVAQPTISTFKTTPSPSTIPLTGPSYLKKSNPASTSHLEDGPNTERHINSLLALFSNPIDGNGSATSASQQNTISSNELDEILSDPELDINIPIDEHGHTALHWAASLAHLSLVRSFLRFGADVNRGSDLGETPLIRATSVSHNYDRGSFNQLLELLHPSLWTLDNQDRTVLHHVCLNANTKDRAESSRYYLECVFEWIVNKHGGQFDSQYIDAIDLNGDTALNIAARVGNKDLIRMLLDVGADKTIGNKLGLKPIDFGVEGEESSTTFPMGVPASSLRRGMGTSIPVRTSRDIINSINSLVSSLSEDFEEEVRSRNNHLESIRAQLKVATRKLTDQRRQIELLKRDLDERSLLELRLKKLRAAVVEEDGFDWTGRSELDGRPSEVGKPFEQNGIGSTLAGLPGAQIELELEPDPFLPIENDAKSLIYLRRMESWYFRVLGLLRERIGRMKGCNLEQEAKYLKVIGSFIGNTCVNEKVTIGDFGSKALLLSDPSLPPPPSTAAHHQNRLLSPTPNDLRGGGSKDKEIGLGSMDEEDDKTILMNDERLRTNNGMNLGAEGTKMITTTATTTTNSGGGISIVHHQPQLESLKLVPQISSSSTATSLSTSNTIPSVIDNKLLSQLMAAIESDGPELDLNRVAGFMQRVQSGLI